MLVQFFLKRLLDPVFDTALFRVVVLPIGPKDRQRSSCNLLAPKTAPPRPPNYRPDYHACSYPRMSRETDRGPRQLSPAHSASEDCPSPRSQTKHFGRDTLLCRWTARKLPSLQEGVPTLRRRSGSLGYFPTETTSPPSLLQLLI